MVVQNLSMERGTQNAKGKRTVAKFRGYSPIPLPGHAKFLAPLESEFWEKWV